MAMVFDPTKNYAEFGNAFFRGRLKGATGEARFKLNADTINAVNTVNIRNAAVTYNFYQKYENIQSTVPLSVVIDVWDDDVYIEVLMYGHGCTSCQIDGVTRPRYNGKGVNHPCLPHNEVISMAKGQHTARLIHPGTSVSADGFIFVKYIRPTGSNGRPGVGHH